ncbi:E3 ubiquitin-protein ligase TRIM39-like [Rhinatrema bivittatum]|uniref:E3 ubiquitin-protein ligase TRIM39-like n=1 Tax=Rhinatrema bivittatum TaxID=194408 RepID=UPI001127D8E0|nr:E3 ubiquitin-protein ligase TRIM39-like [Rhinatrema bivittatum]
MAAESPENNLQDETTCSICLDYFKDPVITDCGHSFCCSCITRCWEELETNFPCPHCRQTFQQRSLKPNRQLSNIVDIAKQLAKKRRRLQEEGLCERHGQALLLFCEEDQEAVCVVCDKSLEHGSHNVILIEEGVQGYKEKLHGHLERLKQDLEAILECKCEEEENIGEVKNYTEIQRQKIVSEFEEMLQFLNNKQLDILNQLEKKEEYILNRIRENVVRLEAKSLSIKNLITEIEEKCQHAGAEFLKDVNSTLDRCTSLMYLNTSGTYIEEIKTFFTFPKLYEVLKDMIHDLLGNVKMDPKTANPEISIYSVSDVQYAEHTKSPLKCYDNPTRFDTEICVLGWDGFTSGRHYWEVKIKGEDKECALGIAKESVPRKGSFDFVPDVGIWAVKMYKGKCWLPTVKSKRYMYLAWAPRKLGIYLDYERGEVTFYNADKFYKIHTFTSSFTEPVYPFFCLLGTEQKIKLGPLQF